MESSCSSTSLISSPLAPIKPSSSFLSSSNSLFFSNGSAAALSRKRLSLAYVRRAGRGPTSRRLGCRCLFGLGVPELVVIAGVAALVFGPKQLPEIGRNIGKTVKSFQQFSSERTEIESYRFLKRLFGSSSMSRLFTKREKLIHMLPKEIEEFLGNPARSIRSFPPMAAKEFETELKKEPELKMEPEDGSMPSQAEGPEAVSCEGERKELETSGTKENV